MKPITLVMPYYENPGMLRLHQAAWAQYHGSLKELLHVIVVDDGSPKRPALPHVKPTGVASFRLYRTLVDVRWNWLFCRNLAMREATTEWALMTDIDHLLSPEVLKSLVRKDHDADCVYRFSRVDAPLMRPYKPHPNSWFLTRKMFDRVGGYDERFSGFYGTDADFRDRVNRRARATVLLKDALIRYPREVQADASTTTYGRKEEQDRVNVTRIRRERAALGQWEPLRCTFPFERLV